MATISDLRERLASLSRDTLVRVSDRLVSEEQAGEPQWQAYLTPAGIADAVLAHATTEQIEAALADVA